MVRCIHPDQDCQCGQEAVWYVWYVGSGGLYTYSCHAHLIARLSHPNHQISQVQAIAVVQARHASTEYHDNAAGHASL